MEFMRRRLIIWFAFGWVFSRVPSARAEPTQPARFAVSTLRAYVDVLIPADETPSGTELAVDKRLLAVAGRQHDYGRLLEMGLDWLNIRARERFGSNFSDLNESGREAIVGEAATARYDTVQRVFFERTRADAFFHYYGRPESWHGISYYRGPSQPLGYMDYAKPPRAKR